MEWLNYHHLLYFWAVAREGGVTRASEQLRLAQATISGQIKLLEDALGERLFERTGRRLVLTDMGRVVYRYADEIFTLGRELQDTVRGRPTGRPLRLVVGVADVIPKLIAHRSSIFTAGGLPGSLYAFGSVPAILRSVADGAKAAPFNCSARACGSAVGLTMASVKAERSSRHAAATSSGSGAPVIATGTCPKWAR